MTSSGKQRSSTLRKGHRPGLRQQSGGRRLTVFALFVGAAGAAFAAAYAFTHARAGAPPSPTAPTAAAAVPASGPAGMRWVPGGEFAMGTDDPRSIANERPARRVRVDGFWVDPHPVTNADFRTF